MIDVNREAELRRAVEALYFGYRAFTALPDAILAEYDLGRAHHRVLYFVQRERGISIGELTAVLAVTKQAVNRPIRDLEALGMLTIEADETDRRVRRLATTPRGAELEARLTGVQAELLADVFDGAGERAEAGWRAVIGRLAGM
ncbi:MarR family winged helix-turn-helix transcriptional regulator [Gordonia humi]|uniref:DNA-binding MarR family transcriptional regulator n=1 Tax=Gordonia humi TaxID=686429 RepID=A0A840F010_9ACTN|nr:MarR family transcriptional regulator [Gordonia humi]MBB4135888.1 DNA-binding MarR family transcriptional regulator [Gordonia humi]